MENLKEIKVAKVLELKQRRTRIIEEQKDLSLKVEKLNIFLYTTQFEELSRDMRYLLVEQYGYMKNYLRILNKRIAIINEQIKNIK